MIILLHELYKRLQEHFHGALFWSCGNAATHNGLKSKRFYRYRPTPGLAAEAAFVPFRFHLCGKLAHRRRNAGNAAVRPCCVPARPDGSAQPTQTWRTWPRALRVGRAAAHLANPTLRSISCPLHPLATLLGGPPLPNLGAFGTLRLTVRFVNFALLIRASLLFALALALASALRLRYLRMYLARSSLYVGELCLNFSARQVLPQTAFLLLWAKNHRPHRHLRILSSVPAVCISNISMTAIDGDIVPRFLPVTGGATLECVALGYGD